MKTVSLEELDKKNCFLHYTPKKNLPSIEKEGLLPKIGPNSKYIERTEKIFFCVGQDGFLEIMDVWLKWLAAKATCPKWFYAFGVWYIEQRFTPKVFSNLFIRQATKRKINHKLADKNLYRTLEESVVLVLDLKEGQDFSYDDVDEVKENYPKKFLKYMYPEESNCENKQIEKWNMHTFSGKSIPASKISLLRMEGSVKANDILEYLIKQNPDRCKEKYPVLFDYYEKNLSK